MVKVRFSRRSKGVSKDDGIHQREWSMLLDLVVAGADPDPDVFATKVGEWNAAKLDPIWVPRYALGLLAETIPLSGRGAPTSADVAILEDRIYPNWARTVQYDRETLRQVLNALTEVDPDSTILGTPVGVISAIVIVASLNIPRSELEALRASVVALAGV